MHRQMKIIKSRYGLFRHKHQRLHPGDTPLHAIAREFKRPQDLRFYLDSLPEEKAVRMAKTTNDEGKLPIDYVSPLPEALGNRVLGQNRIAMAGMLLPYTLKNPFRPMDELLDVHDVLKKFRHWYIRNPELAENLKFACQVANEARSIIQDSSSHPCNNEMSAADRSYEDIAVESMRDRLSEVDIYADEIMQCDVGERRKRLHAAAEIVRKFRAGNCQDYSFVVHDSATEQRPELRAEIFELRVGDHVFVVFGRQPGSDEHDYMTWGDSAVVCDAWAGEVYPASCMEENLYVYCSRQLVGCDDNRQMVTLFNPRFHQVDLYISLEGEEHKKRRLA